MKSAVSYKIRLSFKLKKKTTTKSFHNRFFFFFLTYNEFITNILICFIFIIMNKSYIVNKQTSMCNQSKHFNTINKALQNSMYP